MVRGRADDAVWGSPAGRAGQGVGEEGGRLVWALPRGTHPAVSEKLLPFFVPDSCSALSTHVADTPLDVLLAFVCSGKRWTKAQS